MNFKSLVENASDVFRVCVRCGSFRLRPMSLFCNYCAQTLKNFELPQCRTMSEQKFPVYAQFIWNYDSDSHLRPLIYSLKKGRCRSAMKQFAESFSWNLVQAASKSKSKSIVLIPPPNRLSELDHAGVWARELAQLWKCDVWAPLVEMNETVAQNVLSQKEKSRSDRAKRAYARVKIAKPYVNAKLIFVDDVLTTGSTARAAFKALGEPKDFEVWALAYRPHLATFDAFW